MSPAGIAGACSFDRSQYTEGTEAGCRVWEHRGREPTGGFAPPSRHIFRGCRKSVRVMEPQCDDPGMYAAATRYMDAFGAVCGDLPNRVAATRGGEGGGSVRRSAHGSAGGSMPVRRDACTKECIGPAGEQVRHIRYPAIPLSSFSSRVMARSRASQASVIASFSTSSSIASRWQAQS